MAHFNVCTTQANFYDHYLAVVVAAELFWPLTFLLKLFGAVNINYFSQWGRDWVLQPCEAACQLEEANTAPFVSILLKISILDDLNIRLSVLLTTNQQQLVIKAESHSRGMGERGPRSTLSTWIWRNNVWSPTENHPSSFLSQTCDKLDSCCVPQTLHQPVSCVSHLAPKAAAFTLYRRVSVLLTSKLKRANIVCIFVSTDTGFLLNLEVRWLRLSCIPNVMWTGLNPYSRILDLSVNFTLLAVRSSVTAHHRYI